jgi:MFS family permease
MDAEADRLAYVHNYVLFCLSFSLTHAAVNCVLAYSSTLLGPSLGGYASFTLYLCYSLSNIFAARPALSHLGPKWAVFCGLTGMLAYVVSFFLAAIFPSAAWVVFLFGAFVGGIGAGILWVSQSVYFSLNAAAAAEADSRYSYTETYSHFAGYFAFYYLMFEVIFQGFGLIAFLFNLDYRLWMLVVFGLYSACAVFGWLLLIRVKDLKPTETVEGNGESSSPPLQIEVANSGCAALLVVKEMFSSIQLLFVMPFQM